MSAGPSSPRKAPGGRFCIVASRFNRLVTERLTEGARRRLREGGVASEAIRVVQVPGAWELPWAARRAAEAGFAGIVAVGCVVRGETDHFDYICRAATDGLGRLAAEGRTPVAFGLLTCDTVEQAMARAGGEHGDKGADAAEAVLEMMELAETLS